MSKAIKIPLIIVLILSCLVDAIWITLYFVAPDKTTLNIFNVGNLNGTEDKDGNKQSIIEVNSYKDCFEVKFNYYRDTSSNAMYSTGVQLMNVTSNSFGYQKYKSEGASFLWLGRIYDYYNMVTNCPTYYYNSDENVSFKATNSIVENDGFYISIGEDRYLMRLKYGQGTTFTVNSYNGFLNRDSLLRLDLIYFISRLYSTISSVDTFSSGYITFEFGDLFDYYKETSSGVFEKETEYDNSKIVALTKNYYNIKVNIHNANIQRAEQSLFGQIAFNSNYYVGDIVTSNYYTGLSTYILTEKDFNYTYKTKDKEVGYLLTIKNTAYNYAKSLNNYIFIVYIDKLNLSNNGISNIYITKESFLDLNVLHIYLAKNDDIEEVFL